VGTGTLTDDFLGKVSFYSSTVLDKMQRTLFLCARFIATCSDKTEMIIWDLKGEVLAKVGEF
jgi:hypothetical protein